MDNVWTVRVRPNIGGHRPATSLVMYIVEAREVREVRKISNNKCKIEKDQTTLENFYENSDLSKERKEEI